MKTRCPALRELHLAFDTCGEGESEHDQHRNCQRVFAPGGVELKLLPIPRPSSQPLKTPLIRRGWDEKVQDFDRSKTLKLNFGRDQRPWGCQLDFSSDETPTEAPSCNPNAAMAAATAINFFTTLPLNADAASCNIWATLQRK